MESRSKQVCALLKKEGDPTRSEIVRKNRGNDHDRCNQLHNCLSNAQYPGTVSSRVQSNASVPLYSSTVLLSDRRNYNVLRD